MTKTPPKESLQLDITMLEYNPIILQYLNKYIKWLKIGIEWVEDWVKLNQNYEVTTEYGADI